MKRAIVDPFVPVRRKQPSSAGIAPISIHRPSQPAIKAVSEASIKSPKKPRKKLFGPKLQLVGIMVGAAVIGLLMTMPIAGDVVIAAYGVLVIVLKIKSKTTFMIACGMLVFIILLLFIEPSKTMAMMFATYAFLLLIIGTVTLAFETHRGDERVKGPGLRLRDE